MFIKEVLYLPSMNTRGENDNILFKTFQNIPCDH